MILFVDRFNPLRRQVSSRSTTKRFRNNAQLRLSLKTALNKSVEQKSV